MTKLAKSLSLKTAIKRHNDPEDSYQSIEDTHAAIISRVSEISALKRNAVEDKGNLLLRPIRAAGKAVKKAAPKKKTVKKK